MNSYCPTGDSWHRQVHNKENKDFHPCGVPWTKLKSYNSDDMQKHNNVMIYVLLMKRRKASLHLDRQKWPTCDELQSTWLSVSQLHLRSFCYDSRALSGYEDMLSKQNRFYFSISKNWSYACYTHVWLQCCLIKALSLSRALSVPLHVSIITTNQLGEFLCDQRVQQW